MKVMNPNCFCAGCTEQFSCGDHKLIVRFQSMLNSMGDKGVEVLFKVVKCSKIKKFK